MTRFPVNALLLFIALNAAADVIPTPASPGSSVPSLATAPDGSLLMIWVEEHTVKMARRTRGTWSAAHTIVSSKDVIGNWANPPAIAASGDGALLAVFLEHHGGGMYAGDAMVSASRDGGVKWSTPQPLHRNTKPAEYGFASVIGERSGFGAAWLDGRNVKSEAEGGEQLRYAHVGADGTVGAEEVIDERVCECCITGMTMSARGPLVVYRDRAAGDIRDIASATRGERWSGSKPIHQDGWKINGCPVNGPQVDANGSDVVVAWFTAAGGKKHVLAAFSHDGGATYGNAVTIDEGAPLGRVDVNLLRDGSAVVTWIEGAGDAASIVARRVATNGSLGKVARIARTGASPQVGYARTALADDRLYVAWTEGTPVKQARVAAIPLP